MKYYIAIITIFLFLGIKGQSCISFEPHVLVGDNLPCATSIDLDLDGDIDIISASGVDEGKIWWYENDGNQSFNRKLMNYNKDEYTALYVYDLDMDGDLDIVSSTFYRDNSTYLYEGSIYWSENDGNMNFSEHLISSNVRYPKSVFVVDIDSDNDMDVISASSEDDKISLFINGGTQNFNEQIISTNADEVRKATAYDLDSDGDIDILSASYKDDKIAWYENNGNNSFSENMISNNVEDATDLFVVDLDGDGDIDVLSASAKDDKIWWHKNDGNENFTQQFIADGDVRSIFVSDIDLDGDLDVLSAAYNDDKIYCHYNYGNNNFSNNTYSISSNEYPYYVFVDDIDLDGDIDVLSLSAKYEKLSWHENDSLGNFFENIINPIKLNEPHDICASDIDLDGDLDIVMAGDAGPYALAWFEQIDSFNFKMRNNLLPGVLSTVKVVEAADLDSDGDIDIISGGQYSPNVLLHKNDGLQNFSLDTLSDRNGTSTTDIDIVDIDLDSDLDLLVATEDSLFWLKNNGALNFTHILIHNHATNSDPTISVIDIDSDGDLDLLSNEGADIYLYENNGSQNFNRQQVVNSSYSSLTYFYSKDIDSDGDIDLAATYEIDNKVFWFENDGAYNFTEHLLDNSSYHAHTVLCEDMDSDGDIDILYSNSFLENDGNQNFSKSHYLSFGNKALTDIQFPVDMDGDTDYDILGISTNLYGNKGGIQWYENLKKKIVEYDSLEICEGDSILLGGQYQSIAGIYNDTLVASGGCDSVVIYDLKINSVHDSVIVNGATLTAHLIGSSYQWINCDSNYTVIAGQNGQSYTPNSNGNYAVVIMDQNSCIDTSDCYSIISVNILNYSFDKIPNLYPNPTLGVISIDLNGLNEECSILMKTIEGKVISKTIHNFSNKKELVIKEEPGIYFFEIIGNEGLVAKFKIIKR